MWRWKPRACTGSPCGTCWKTTSRWSSPTPCTFGTSRAQERQKRRDVDRRSAWRWARSAAASCPPAPIQELRDLTRTRKQLVREITRHTQRIQKTLEDANLKLTEVLSDLLGTEWTRHPAGAGRRRDRPRAVWWTSPRALKATRAQLVEALHGPVTAHHRFMIQLHLAQIAALEPRSPTWRRHPETARPLSRRRQPLDHDARASARPPRRHPGGDRQRHVQVSQRGPSRLLGRVVSPLR